MGSSVSWSQITGNSSTTTRSEIFAYSQESRTTLLPPTHPQANEQVEVTNQSLLKIIKTRLERAKGIWLEELPSVLWAYRTTSRTPIWETLFWIAYGSEAVIPTKVRLTSYKVDNYNVRRNDEAMHLQLDLVDKVRATAEQRLARYQDLMAKHYNSKVRHRDFKVGDLILRKVMGPLETPPKESLALTGRDPIESLHGRGKAPTTWRLQTDRSCTIHRTPSISGDITNR